MRILKMLICKLWFEKFYSITFKTYTRHIYTDLYHKAIYPCINTFLKFHNTVN